MAEAENVKASEDVALSGETEEVKAEERKKEKRLIGSFPAKVAAFFLLAVSSFVAAGSIICGVVALATGMYEGSTPGEVFMDMGMSQIRTAAYRMRNYIQDETEEWLIQEYFESSNCDVDTRYPHRNLTMWISCILHWRRETVPKV